MTEQYRIIINGEDLAVFTHCPKCGHDDIIVGHRDYLTDVFCMNDDCDWEWELLNVTEYKRRYENGLNEQEATP